MRLEVVRKKFLGENHVSKHSCSCGGVCRRYSMFCRSVVDCATRLVGSRVPERSAKG